MHNLNKGVLQTCPWHMTLSILSVFICSPLYWNAMATFIILTQTSIHFLTKSNWTDLWGYSGTFSSWLVEYCLCFYNTWFILYCKTLIGLFYDIVSSVLINKLPGGYGETLISSICWFPWYKYSHRGHFEVINGLMV